MLPTIVRYLLWTHWNTTSPPESSRFSKLLCWEVSAWQMAGYVLPCGTKFLRFPIFAIFAGFFSHDPQKEFLQKNCGKNFLRKSLLRCRNYIQTSPFT